MKNYPTSMKLSSEMKHFKAAPNTVFLRLFSSGVINIDQMKGGAPFPFPSC